MSRSRILCVEDDPEISGLLSEVLTEEGFAVEVAASGPEGWASLDAGDERIDAVICDIDLPGYSGLDLLRRGRDAGTALPPFIFLTAFSGRANQIEARQLGCDDFVSKPIDFELLVTVLRNVMQRTLSRAGDRAKTDGVTLQLTPREREVMSFVSRGKSSAEIARLAGISERTVNYHIERVMRKVSSSTRTQAAVYCASAGLLES